jgi:hypothetical protein
MSVQDIRTRVGVLKGGVNEGKQSPLTLVMPVKSPNHLAAASQLIAKAMPGFCEAAEAIGTIHFARFLALGTSALAIVSEYDGSFEQHTLDLSTHLGPLFDEILQNVVHPPRTPVERNRPAFEDWVSARNIQPWWFYTAYPNLSVQDIRSQAGKAGQAGK